MKEHARTLRGALFAHRSFSAFRGISEYVRTRPLGDQFLLAVFGCIIAIVSVVTVLTLEQRLLVKEPAYGGSLTEGDVGAPRFINPLLALSETDQDLAALTYAGLMGQGPNGTLVPILAKSYEVSPDEKTYTFTLRDNVTFSDGTPVTAADVLFTVQKAQDQLLKSPAYANWNMVTVTALNARTVQFTLAAPYAPFLENATLGILPAHLWRNVSNNEFPFSDLMIKPVGAGPFTATHFVRNGSITRYDLVANQKYATGRPYLDALHFVFFNDRVSLQAALSKHQIESGYGITSPNIIKAPYSRLFAVFFNASGNAALANQSVRQALSIAINRENIVKNLLGGYATQVAGPLPPENDAANTVPAAFPAPENRIASSSAILAGQAITITLKTLNVPELRAIAESIQTDWQQLGVPTSIQFYEAGDLTSSVIRPRSFQALLFGMVIGKGDDLYAFWDSKERVDPGLNITGYSNPKVDQLLTQLRTERDRSARRSDLAQLNELIAADYPAAFIDSPDFVYAVPKDLKGVILQQITSPSDRFANVASWYRRTESVWPFLARSR